MSDFNADNAKLDAALAALAAKVSGGLQVITGAYQGTGETVRTHYDLGARPSLLILTTNNSPTSGTYARILIATESFCLNIGSTGSQSFISNFITFDESGFTLDHGIMHSNQGYNAADATHTYWALI
jgi:hypothetical protein